MRIPRPLIAVVTSSFALLAACQPARDTPPERQPPFIDIGDGSKVTARGALRSAGELAIKLNVTIYFTHEELGQGSISVCSQKQQRHWADIDFLSVTLTKDQIIFGDDLTTREERRKKFREYSLGGRMTESTPVLVLDAGDDVPGTKLIEVLHELLEAKLTTIIAPYHFVVE